MEKEKRYKNPKFSIDTIEEAYNKFLSLLEPGWEKHITHTFSITIGDETIDYDTIEQFFNQYLKADSYRLSITDHRGDHSQLYISAGSYGAKVTVEFPNEQKIDSVMYIFERDKNKDPTSPRTGKSTSVIGNAGESKEVKGSPAFPSSSHSANSTVQPTHRTISVTQIIVTIAAIATIITLVIVFYDRIVPPSAELTIDVVSPDANLMIDASPNRIQFAPEIRPEPINAEITLLINNIGKAPARDIYIEFLHEPQSNNWFDHHAAETIEGAVQDRGSNQGYQGILRADSAIRIKYNVTIWPELFNDVKEDRPTITFDIKYDGDKRLIRQYLVCFDDCRRILG